MSYHALYRAYRPQKFSDVVGQKHIVRTIQNALKDIDCESYCQGSQLYPLSNG